MPRYMIFTPTQRPGLDVSLYSVLRQHNVEIADAVDLYWLIIDELFEERKDVVNNLFKQYRDKFKVIHGNIGRKDTDVRNLARAYNYAIGVARELDIDILISLQDYIWAPPDGLSKFIQMDQGGARKAIYTGICNISTDPRPDLIHDKLGNFTIFNEPYNKEPNEIDWIDTRQQYRPLGEYWKFIAPMEWELNWAAIGSQALYDENLYFDEAYDKGVAYENQDYAYRAAQNGYDIVIDYSNKAISLPHKEYWPEEWEYEAPYTQNNRKLTETLWPRN